jgi:transcription antitermination factor NusG
VKRWLALYTRPKAEKKLQHYLLQRGISHYLPLNRVKKKWSDRYKWVEEPLFKGYIFVEITDNERFDVLNIPGAVRFVSFNGSPAPIRASDIDFLKKLLETDYEISTMATPLATGSKVLIDRGPLTGYYGTLIQYEGNKKVKVDVEHLEYSLVISIPLNFLIAAEL